jgi:hypothetical protein
MSGPMSVPNAKGRILEYQSGPMSMPVQREVASSVETIGPMSLQLNLDLSNVDIYTAFTKDELQSPGSENDDDDDDDCKDHVVVV